MNHNGTRKYFLTSKVLAASIIRTIRQHCETLMSIYQTTTSQKVASFILIAMRT
jgi:hypothetical protein